MEIKPADMQKIQALLPSDLRFTWDEGAVAGAFHVSCSAKCVTVSCNGDQRVLCLGYFLSIPRMPLEARIELPTGRGWHAEAAKHLQKVLCPQEAAQRQYRDHATLCSECGNMAAPRCEKGETLFAQGWPLLTALE